MAAAVAQGSVAAEKQLAREKAEQAKTAAEAGALAAEKQKKSIGTGPRGLITQDDFLRELRDAQTKRINDERNAQLKAINDVQQAQINSVNAIREENLKVAKENQAFRGPSGAGSIKVTKTEIEDKDPIRVTVEGRSGAADSLIGSEGISTGFSALDEQRGRPRKDGISTGFSALDEAKRRTLGDTDPAKFLAEGAAKRAASEAFIKEQQAAGPLPKLEKGFNGFLDRLDTIIDRLRETNANRPTPQNALLESNRTRAAGFEQLSSGESAPSGAPKPGIGVAAAAAAGAGVNAPGFQLIQLFDELLPQQGLTGELTTSFSKLNESVAGLNLQYAESQSGLTAAISAGISSLNTFNGSLSSAAEYLRNLPIEKQVEPFGFPTPTAPRAPDEFYPNSSDIVVRASTLDRFPL